MPLLDERISDEDSPHTHTTYKAKSAGMCKHWAVWEVVRDVFRVNYSMIHHTTRPGGQSCKIGTT